LVLAKRQWRREINMNKIISASGKALFLAALCLSPALSPCAFLPDGYGTGIWLAGAALAHDGGDGGGDGDGDGDGGAGSSGGSGASGGSGGGGFDFFNPSPQKGRILPYPVLRARVLKAVNGRIIGVRRRKKHGGLIFMFRIIDRRSRLVDVHVNAANAAIVRIRGK
jgi:hypothetical protein